MFPEGYACPIKTFLLKPCKSSWETPWARLGSINRDEQKRQRTMNDRLFSCVAPIIGKTENRSRLARTSDHPIPSREVRTQRAWFREGRRTTKGPVFFRGEVPALRCYYVWSLCSKFEAGPPLTVASTPYREEIFHEGADQAVPRRWRVAPATDDWAECTRHEHGRRQCDGAVAHAGVGCAAGRDAGSTRYRRSAVRGAAQGRGREIRILQPVDR